MRRNCHLATVGTAFAALLVWVAPVPVQAHGEVHEIIALISREIEAKPKAASLRFERASLYAQNDHFTEALEDLAQVNALDPANDLPTALRGNIFRRMGKPVEARAQQEAFLKKHPAHAQVRFDYCQTLAELKETGAALRELDALITAAEHPAPDAVAMRLRLTEVRGADGPAAALEWLDAFLSTHPLPVFEEEALRLEIKLNRPNGVVKRMDAMIAKVPRPESLCLRKAEYLAASGDKAGAESAARAAVEAIGRLPSHVRGTPATAALEARAKQILSPPE